MNKIIIAAAVGGALAVGALVGPGTASADTASNSASEGQVGSGGSFLPAYLAMLQGKQPQDDSCSPRDLHDLLVPCDKP